MLRVVTPRLILPASTKPSLSLKDLLATRWSTERTQSKILWTTVLCATTIQAPSRKQNPLSVRQSVFNSLASAREVASTPITKNWEARGSLQRRMGPVLRAHRLRQRKKRVAWWKTSWRLVSTNTKTMSKECKIWLGTREVKRQSTSSSPMRWHLSRSRVVVMMSLSSEPRPLASQQILN